MGWVYLDDKFPDHPKTQLVGGDGAWMFVCGLAYCNRNETGGRIPKAAVGQLTDRRGPANIAARLVKHVLWEDDGDDYYLVHDYDVWQASALAAYKVRVAKAEKAAKARWDKAKRDAQADAQASDEQMHEQSSDDASRAGSPPPTTPPPVVTSSSTSNLADGSALVEEAYEILVERHFQRRVGDPLQNPAGWRKSLVKGFRKQHGERAAHVVATEPGHTPESLADVLEPPTNGHVATPLDASQQAQRRLMERDRSCVECRGTGWRENGSGVVPCDCKASA